MIGAQPTDRDLWLRIREELPKKRRANADYGEEPRLPGALQGALESLYSNYRLYHEKWAAKSEALAKGQPPPVFIAVCNNPAFQNWCSITSPGGRRRLRMARRSLSRAPWLCSAMRRTENGCTGQIRSWWTAHNWNRVKPCGTNFGARRRWRSRSSRRNTGNATPDRDVDALTEEDLLCEVQYHRQAGQAGRTDQMRGERFDADGGLGREHGDAYSGRARLRNAVALRTGGGPRAAADVLRAR